MHDFNRFSKREQWGGNVIFKELLPVCFCICNLNNITFISLLQHCANGGSHNQHDFPFYKTRNDILKLSFVIYAAIWVIITVAHLIMIIFSYVVKDIREVIISPMIGYLVMDMLPIFTEDDSLMICICVPYVIPAVICMACFIVQAHKLLRKTEVSSDVNKRITITIFYLSGVFFVCNTAMCVTFIVYLYVESEEDSKKDSEEELLFIFMVSHFSNTILGFANSAMNPIILILRGRDLQRFTRSLFKGSSVSENANVGNVVIIPAATETTLRSDV